ncbi:MAG: hypothetical protein SGARI_003831, partial [Bacillariaceae sp.]
MARLESQVASRLEREEPLTEREKQLLDDILGEENFALFERKNGLVSEEERLLRRLEFLEFIENKMPVFNLMKKMGALEIARRSFRQLLDGKPTQQENGLPVNAELLRSFGEYKRMLKHPNAVLADSSDVSSVLTDPLRPDISDLRSPFGPISSVSCFEELGTPVDLEHLAAHLGTPMPHCRIVLKIVTRAVISPSKAVSMVVSDETGQYVLLQIHNLRNAQDEMQNFTPGARYFLRNPFLKPSKDDTPFLRVDQPFDLVRLDLPPLHGSILVVGDGDFSFSVAIARQNKIRGDAYITATSLDSADDVKNRYRKGKKNLKKLAADKNVELLHGI